jgi:hypothetical protein
MRLKGMRRLGSNLIMPLLILGLAALVLVTDFSPRFTLQALQHDAGFGLGIPFPSVHG